MEEKASPRSNFWKELLKLVVIAVIFVIPFRLYVAQPFIVDGLSMYPTFGNGNYLIIDELTYQFKTPERGSVLVFKYPKDPDKYFIKRVIGLPGEIVTIKDGKVSVTSNDHPKGLVLNEPYVKLPKDEDLSYVLGQGQYFVMGDNRASSADSRVWGAVPAENIIGRPIVSFVPPRLFPGDISHFKQAPSNSLGASNQDNE
jgi:signal peptidase I